MTDTGKKLMRLLKDIYNDHDFVCGTMSNCGNEEAWEQMYEFITFAKEHGEHITSDDILALSLSLGEKTDTEKGWHTAYRSVMAMSL